MQSQTKETFFKGYDIFDLQLSIYSKAIYFYLCKCKNHNNTCFPSHFDISIKVGCSVSKVKTGLKELEEIGLINKKHRFFESKRNKQAQTSNLYTVYPYPKIKIDSDASINHETSIDVKFENNKTTGQLPQNYELDELLNNIKPIENKSINLSSVQSNQIEKPIQTKQIDMNDHILQDLQSIFQNCNLKLYNKSSQNIIKFSIINMFCNDSFSIKNNTPKILIQECLRRLTMQTIDEALTRYAEAVESGVKIYSHNLYFEKILWNSIVSSSLDEYMADVG